MHARQVEQRVRAARYRGHGDAGSGERRIHCRDRQHSLPQVLEGTTRQVPPGVAVSVSAGSLTVKSNISWILVARVWEGQEVLASREVGGSIAAPQWDVMARGEKGVHPIQSAVRREPAMALAGPFSMITFSVAPAQ